MDEILLSLIVCTRNRNGELRRLLRSTYPLPKEFEIVIVDQNADNSVYELAEEDRGYNIKLIRESFSCLSKARNAGLKLCRGSFIGIPDDDCWYEEAFADQLVAELREAHMDERCVGVVLGWWVFSGFPSKQRRLKGRETLRYGNSGTLITKREIIDRFVNKEVFENRMSPGSRYPAGDETLFAARACKYGKGYYKAIPHVRMDHKVFEVSRDRERLYAPGFGALAYSLLRLGWGPGIELAIRIIVGPFIMVLVNYARGERNKAELDAIKALYRCRGFVRFGYEEVKDLIWNGSDLVGS